MILLFNLKNLKNRIFQTGHRSQFDPQVFLSKSHSLFQLPTSDHCLSLKVGMAQGNSAPSTLFDGRAQEVYLPLDDTAGIWTETAENPGSSFSSCRSWVMLASDVRPSRVCPKAQRMIRSNRLLTMLEVAICLCLKRKALWQILAKPEMPESKHGNNRLTTRLHQLHFDMWFLVKQYDSLLWIVFNIVIILYYIVHQ